MGNRRKPLLSKLDSGGSLVGGAGSGASHGGPSGDKVYNDINNIVGKFFDFCIDMVEEVFDVKLTRTKKKGKSKFW